MNFLDVVFQLGSIFSPRDIPFGPFWIEGTLELCPGADKRNFSQKRSAVSRALRKSEVYTTVVSRHRVHISGWEGGERKEEQKIKNLKKNKIIFFYKIEDSLSGG